MTTYTGVAGNVWWMAATVRAQDFELAEGERQWGNCRVYATPQGLVIYRHKPIQGEEPDWSSPINFHQTRRPDLAMYAWHDIYTDAGLLSVSGKSAGCGRCGSRGELHRWMPTFAMNTELWPAS